MGKFSLNYLASFFFMCLDSFVIQPSGCRRRQEGRRRSRTFQIEESLPQNSCSSCERTREEIQWEGNDIFSRVHVC